MPPKQQSTVYPDCLSINYLPCAHPTGPAGAFIRVIRGGDWDHEGVRCRRASRLKTLAGNKTSFLGFRLALTQ